MGKLKDSRSYMKLNRNVNWPKVSLMFSSQFTKVRTLLHLSSFLGETGHYFQCDTILFYYFTLINSLLC